MRKTMIVMIFATVLMFSLVSAVPVMAASNGGGFDEFGYNLKARNFVGTGESWCMGKLGWGHDTCETYMGVYAHDTLVMKWNAEWDRGNDEGWTDPDGYDAWLNNEWNGAFPGGSGSVWHYKIKWIGPCTDIEFTDGGYCIWGQFEVLMDQGIDPSYGPGHLWFALAKPAGYGN